MYLGTSKNASPHLFTGMCLHSHPIRDYKSTNNPCVCVCVLDKLWMFCVRNANALSANLRPAAIITLCAVTNGFYCNDGYVDETLNAGPKYINPAGI